LNFTLVGLNGFSYHGLDIGIYNIDGEKVYFC